MNIQARFDRMTVAINQNPAGFRKSATGKRRFARGAPFVSPYEKLAAQVYGEKPKTDESARGIAKRALLAMTNFRVSEVRPRKYMHAAAALARPAARLEAA